MRPDSARKVNLLGLTSISLVLLFAFVDQFAYHDVPCPLCLLQRAGFFSVGIGFGLNIRFGSRSAHYALMLLGAVVGGAISVRHILLHLVPGTGGYGPLVFGLHFYTWAFVLFSLIIVGVALMLMFDPLFSYDVNTMPVLKGAEGVVIIIFGLLALSNAVSVALECGGSLCVDNPLQYQLFSSSLRLRGIIFGSS